MDLQQIEQGMRQILAGIGTEHVNAEVASKTPHRVAKMFAEFFDQIERNPADVLEVLFQEEYDQMVVVKGITFFSICEHHFLPFVGTADIVYIPKADKIVGASKLARALDIAASRPQLQERLTSQLADAIMERLTPHGVLLRIEATHQCMTLRGAKKPGTTMVTSAIRGIFRTDRSARAEALALIT
ncbi:GTP cyclohydrolase I FolE [Candidatus Bipolaricaulota bacterium]|nr:GTP cyclohydrolase I FolE [Candidatus Bipolaricaulota bacterium]